MKLPNLEDMSIGHRAMLTVAVIVIILVLLACASYLSGRWEAGAQVQPSPVDTRFAKRLNELDAEAVETAYRTQLTNLFLTWMKDPSGQPARAVVGANQARRAFTAAMTEIEQRKNMRESP
jgi:hypothetical protein